MADEKETRQWVGDQLLNVLGLNTPTMVSFVIGIGKRRMQSEIYVNLHLEELERGRGRAR